MPIITYHRIWCKTCNEFTLHFFNKNNENDESGYFCKDCKTKYSDILLKEIPNNKILEQRERYEKSKKEDFNNMLNGYLNPNFSFLKEMKNMFSEPGSNIEIVESDAGQKLIDEKILEKRKEELKKYNEEREEAKKYKHLGRNEKCLCGSNLKYKNCCLKRILKYNI